MQLQTILNLVQPYKSFVYESARVEAFEVCEYSRRGKEEWPRRKKSTEEGWTRVVGGRRWLGVGIGVTGHRRTEKGT
jgi:hypothetical protein